MSCIDIYSCGPIYLPAYRFSPNQGDKDDEWLEVPTMRGFLWTIPAKVDTMLALPTFWPPRSVNTVVCDNQRFGFLEHCRRDCAQHPRLNQVLMLVESRDKRPRYGEPCVPAGELERELAQKS